MKGQTMLPQESSVNPGGPFPAPPPRTSGMAVASMVIGIVGLVFMLVLPIFAVLGVLAVIFAHVALGQMRKDPALTGRGLAIAGLSTGYVGVGVAVLIVLVVMAAV